MITGVSDEEITLTNIVKLDRVDILRSYLAEFPKFDIKYLVTDKDGKVDNTFINKNKIICQMASFNAVETLKFLAKEMDDFLWYYGDIVQGFMDFNEKVKGTGTGERR
jgi:hypothetical protein